MSSIAPNPAAYYLIHNLKLAMYCNLFVGIAFGISVTFYAVSIHILVGRPGLLSSRPRMFMLAITTFIFILCLIGLVSRTVLGFRQMYSLPDPTSGRIQPFKSANMIYSTIEATYCIINILSDIICAWRAVVLWNKDKRVIAILLLFILGNIAAIGSALGVITPISNLSIQETKPREHALVMVGTSLGINLLCTGLIGWKAWEHRVTIRKHLGEGTVSTRVEKTFAILIESGLVYCCLWILYLIAAFGVIPDPFATAMDEALLFAPGAYPTLIIIFVCLQKSPVDYCSTHPSGMRFANNEPSPGSHNQTGLLEPQQDEEKSASEPEKSW